MKTKTIIKSKNVEQKIKITVEMDATGFLMASEMRAWKRKMQNKIYHVLIEDGYDVSDLVVK